MNDNSPPFNISMKFILQFLLPILLSGTISMNAWAQLDSNSCGSLANGFGPFDYRSHAGSEDARKNPNNPLRLVEGAHFKPHFEALSGGKISRNSPIGPEFDYVLRAFPNHPRALNAAIRLSEKLKQDPPQGMRYNIECWFERAIRFQSDDLVVRMLYASYLGKIQRTVDAKKQLEVVKSLAGMNPLTQYNIGLIYFDLGELGLALDQAHLASAMGVPRTELRDRLMKSGHWRDPSPTTQDYSETTTSSEEGKP